MEALEKERLRKQLKHYLAPAKNKGFFICPLCGSGTGPKQTGALRLLDDELHCKCFACDFYGDLFDLVGAQYALPPAEAFAKAASLVGDAPPPALPAASAGFATAAASAPANYTAYLAACATALQRHPAVLAYLRGRGFTDATITAARLGYDADKRQLVIPYGGAGPYFIRRGVGERKIFFKPPVAEAGPEPLFNAAALYDGAVCFVVESQLCALSVRQAGAPAVALGGAGAAKLLAQLERQPTTAILLLALDNDAGGRATLDRLKPQLEALGIPYVVSNIAGEAKDPNEALQRDAAAFAQRVGDAARQAPALVDAQAQEEQQAYRAQSVAAQLPVFMEQLRCGSGSLAVATGFAALDAALDDGLHEGLYVLGALSSLGKTTFCLQLADQIARQGRAVLFFSLEMSRRELIAKSLSRLTFSLSGGNTALAQTVRGILAAGRYAGYSEKEKQLLENAAAEYGRAAGHLFVQEGGPAAGTAQLFEAVERHNKLCGTAPVVIVDYLQILTPAEPRATDKQNTDRAVFELKRLSREYAIPVLAVSSLNRESYGGRLSMASFKESGAIEYSSDVLLGLQFQLPPGEERLSAEQLDDCKRAEERKVELRILKNRSGVSGQVLPFLYRAAHNFFAEARADTSGFFERR